MAIDADELEITDGASTAFETSADDTFGISTDNSDTLLIVCPVALGISL